MRAEPQRSPAAASAAVEDFRVTAPTDCLALLAELRDGNEPVLLHARGGATLNTVLRVVDAEGARLAFALGATDLESPRLAALLDADEVTAVARPGLVKVQFDLHDLVLVRGHAHAVLHCSPPEEILRFQRRDTFRVCPPVTAPVAHLRHPSIPEMSLALRVLDLSLGGCALRLPDDVPSLAPGTQIGGAVLELDALTRLRIELTLQHVTRFGEGGGMADGGGTGGARLGCEWRLVRPEDERTLQRWIDQAQVRQRQQERARRTLPGASG